MHGRTRYPFDRTASRNRRLNDGRPARAIQPGGPSPEFPVASDFPYCGRRGFSYVWAIVERATNRQDRVERSLPVVLRLVYLLTGPPAACFFGLKIAEMLFGWPEAEATQENVYWLLGQAVSLLTEMVGLPISVLAAAAAILRRRRWREVLPLWLLAAGVGMAWVALRYAEGAPLEAYARLTLLLFGLTASWVGCTGGMSHLTSFLTRYSS